MIGAHGCQILKPVVIITTFDSPPATQPQGPQKAPLVATIPSRTGRPYRRTTGSRASVYQPMTLPWLSHPGIYLSNLRPDTSRGVSKPHLVSEHSLSVTLSGTVVETAESMDFMDLSLQERRGGAGKAGVWAIMRGIP